MSYVTSDAGQQAAAEAAGSAPLPGQPADQVAPADRGDHRGGLTAVRPPRGPGRCRRTSDRPAPWQSSDTARHLTAKDHS